MVRVARSGQRKPGMKSDVKPRGDKRPKNWFSFARAGTRPNPWHDRDTVAAIHEIRA
jgi:hypothetical protein